MVPLVALRAKSHQDTNYRPEIKHGGLAKYSHECMRKQLQSHHDPRWREHSSKNLILRCTIRDQSSTCVVSNYCFCQENMSGQQIQPGSYISFSNLSQYLKSGLCFFLDFLDLKYNLAILGFIWFFLLYFSFLLHAQVGFACW